MMGEEQVARGEQSVARTASQQAARASRPPSAAPRHVALLLERVAREVAEALVLRLDLQRALHALEASSNRPLAGRHGAGPTHFGGLAILNPCLGGLPLRRAVTADVGERGRERTASGQASSVRQGDLCTGRQAGMLVLERSSKTSRGAATSAEARPPPRLEAGRAGSRALAVGPLRVVACVAVLVVQKPAEAARRGGRRLGH
eukprot:3511611-Prymnesium_polylepis.1